MKRALIASSVVIVVALVACYLRAPANSICDVVENWDRSGEC